jgi:hypothetical protein
MEKAHKLSNSEWVMCDETAEKDEGKSVLILKKHTLTECGRPDV